VHRGRRLSRRRPDHIDVVEEELGVAGGDCGVLELGLGHQQAVEGIPVVKGELGHPQGVRVLDREGRQPHGLQAARDVPDRGLGKLELLQCTVLMAISQELAAENNSLTAAAGRPLPAIDSLIAATALTHDLRLVTRNTKDFKLPGLELVNPWSSRQ
jgi:hypothetical protein